MFTKILLQLFTIPKNIFEGCQILGFTIFKMWIGSIYTEVVFLNAIYKLYS